MKIKLLRITEDAERLIADAARLTRGNEKDNHTQSDDAKLIRHLITLGHESVLEHAVATFLITDISRACLAQLTRHRLASYTVISQRHTEPPPDAYIIPPSIEAHPELKKRIEDLFNQIWSIYFELRKEAKIRKEDARFILPQATTTTLVMTANFREWRHIIRLRTAKDAQWEIRELCKKILTELHRHAPSVFSDLIQALD